MGESLEEAAVREMREEVGLDVAPERLHLYRIASIPDIGQVYVGFRLPLAEEPKLVCGPEASEARLYYEHEIGPGMLAFGKLVPNVPGDFFRCIRKGSFPIVAETIRNSGGSF